jgi:hypothetical protein
MPETPNPTREEFLDYLPLVSGRPSVGLKEIVRRLQANLPARLADLNDELGYPAGKGIPVPKGYGLAPAKLGDKHRNMILVGLSQGGAGNIAAFSPGTFKGELAVAVYSINQAWREDEQQADDYDRAGAIMGALYPFLTGCLDASERLCWKLLEPKDIGALPEAWKEFSGVTVHYRMVLPPNMDNWH